MAGRHLLQFVDILFLYPVVVKTFHGQHNVISCYIKWYCKTHDFSQPLLTSATQLR